jgi:hypothetical protein
MSKKKALPDDVGNFFEGESMFFPDAPQRPEHAASPENKIQKKPNTEVESPTSETRPAPTPKPGKGTRPKAVSVPPSNQANITSSSHETMPPRHHDTTTPSMVEVVRKAVKRVGKEAATYRFTQEEKQHLADIVYTYGRQGYRTSENEITRIAVNWLLLDYQEQGAQSVLARLLEALHE